VLSVTATALLSLGPATSRGSHVWTRRSGRISEGFNTHALDSCLGRRNAAVRLYDSGRSARAERSLRYCFQDARRELAVREPHAGSELLGGASRARGPGSKVPTEPTGMRTADVSGPRNEASSAVSRSAWVLAMTDLPSPFGRTQQASSFRVTASPPVRTARSIARSIPASSCASRPRSPLSAASAAIAPGAVAHAVLASRAGGGGS
jgi:hypothetical protein